MIGKYLPLLLPQYYTSSSTKAVAPKMESSNGSTTSQPAPAVVKLKPIEATPETFQEFGQVIEASPDGEEFGPADAQLDLSRGIPRFPLPLPLPGLCLSLSISLFDFDVNCEFAIIN